MMNELWKSFRTTLLLVGIIGLVFFLEGVVANPKVVFWIGGSFIVATTGVGLGLVFSKYDYHQKPGVQTLGFAAALLVLEIPLYYFGWM